MLLKRGLLLFWASWLSLVFATNVLDGAKETGLLAGSWSLTSENYPFLAQTTARHGPPDWVNAVLFGGVICWEGLAAALFWRAWWSFGGRATGRSAAYAATAAGLSLWAAFLLADEVCVAYAVEATHWRLFIAQLATLLAIELLPEAGPGAGRG